MIEKSIEVFIKNGLHARPAGELVKMLKQYDCDVFLIKGEKKINLKSIIQIMSTSIRENDVIRVQVNGKDEAEAARKLEKFFRNGKIDR